MSLKTIGIIGGMSWESTALYYRALNEGVREKLGGLHSAKIVMESLDFHDIEKLQASGAWDEAADVIGGAGKRLKKAGADFLLLATNTMHIVADQVEASAGLPLLHIADTTAQEIVRLGFTSVGLLGTAFTMEQGFYKDRLEAKFGLNVLTPDAGGRALVHDVIYNELCKGNVFDASRNDYLIIIDELLARGAEAIILGCTEIGMLVKPEHINAVLFDTMAIHAEAAVERATSNEA